MADDWERKIEAFEAKLQKRIVQVHARVAFALRDSIVDGSPITGAPGQPVDTGNLKASWQLTFPTPLLARLVTSAVYAEAIENGVGPSGPMVLQSEVGGFHSVRQTRTHFQKLVDKIVREVARD